MKRGFTLLEVMISLAILAVGLVSISSLNGGAVAMHAYGRRATEATLLLRSKMLDIEDDLQKKGFSDFDDERHGDFTDENPSSDYTWSAEILKPDVQLDPGQLLSAVSGGAIPGSGQPQAASGPQPVPGASPLMSGPGGRRADAASPDAPDAAADAATTDESVPPEPGEPPMTRRGFTLLEVMIAIAVLAMIGAITWKSFDGAYGLKQRVERAEDRDQTVRGALDRISREVSMTFLSEHYDRKRFRERPTFFRLKDGRREASLTFTSLAHQRLHVDAKESDEAVFEYRLDRDEGKTSLFRRVKPQIDEDSDRGGERAVLAEDVLRFSVQAWDPKDREWRDEWDSNSPQRTGGVLVPPRVRIAITVKDEQGKERTWSTQARLQLVQPLDF